MVRAVATGYAVFFMAIYSTTIVIQPCFANTYNSYSVKMDQDVYSGRRLTSHVIETHAISRPLACYAKCMSQCRCISFNVCENGKKCELSSERKDDHPADYGQEETCTYYEFTWNKGTSGAKSKTETCGGCCSTSQPCSNGGKCEPVYETDGQRFQCNCPDGFNGTRCEMKPRSCADYAQSSNRTHGIRVIYTGDGTTLRVFCHFRTNSAMTLSMSYSRANSVNIDTHSLTKDFPLNEDSMNWDYYRLSLAHMRELRDVSTHWAFTCSYHTRGFSTTDYVISAINQTDVTNYEKNPGGNTEHNCRRYQYLNINNNVCENCRILTYQGTYIFNMPASDLDDCDGFQLSEGVLTCTSNPVRYFGYYVCYATTTFTCTNSPSATTQLWFIR